MTLARDGSVDGGRTGLPDLVVEHVPRGVPLALLDLATVFLCYLAPLVLRFSGAVPPEYWSRFLRFGSVAAALHLLCNYLFGLYGQMWRYASVLEARRVVMAGATAGLLVIGTTMWLGSAVVPLSVGILGPMFSLVAFGGIRFQSRLFAFRRRTATSARRRVLIVGAGDGGAIVIRDLFRNPGLQLDPVGLIDDDPRKRRLYLHGVEVLGPRAEIPALTQALRVDEILLAIPSATSDVIRDVATLCEEAGVPLRVLPSLREIVGGRVTAHDIRDLSIGDLLGRQQMSIDVEAVLGVVRGRRVLVTGAGGSIGSEIARQVSGFEPGGLFLLDHDETHLHDLATELGSGVPFEPILADIRDRDRLISTFMRIRPEVVFHSAAHKHVPVLETNPEEAVFTNVLGTANVADAVAASGAERLVLISTDKAVRPASVMGASKWFAEQIVRSLAGAGCVYSAVRFGNVLGSRGSVIPTFLRQVSGGGPVTVTDPAMTRYFMSIQEAVLLVLQAAALSRGGEVFTLDMGEPVNILDLARRVIRMSGRVPERDVPITFVGMRPGEKLVEDLVDPTETPLPSGHPGIVVSQPSVLDRAALRRAIRELEALALEGRSAELATRIKEISLVEIEPAQVRVG